MSELKKYWVRETYWTDDFHIEPGNPYRRVPLYKAAEVEQMIAELISTLRALHDVQNGSPLPKYDRDWKAAMEDTERLLAEWEKQLCEESVEAVLASDYDELRAENERLKGEIDTLDSLLKDRTAQLAAEHKERVRFQKYHEEGGRVNAELKDQLEAMTKERDEALAIQQSEECAYESTISDLIFERDNLWQQLADAQSRVKELEGATALDVDRMERAAVAVETLNEECNRRAADNHTLIARCAQLEAALRNIKGAAMRRDARPYGALLDIERWSAEALTPAAEKEEG